MGNSERIYADSIRSKMQPASADMLLRLFFDPEDGGDMFLLNIGLSP
jgi:hypothetical protein